MNCFKSLDYAYIEFYVGMAKMVTYWHVKALGFDLVGYRGPETGSTEELSFLLQKNGITLVITSATKPSCFEILNFVDRHGNGVKRIAYRVPDVEQAYQQALENHAIPVSEPQKVSDGEGFITEAAIRLMDQNEILFFNDANYEGLFRPQFEPITIPGFTPDFDNGFETIDHIAYGLRTNEMDFWCRYYQGIFGGETLQELKPGDLVTEYSGMLLTLIGSTDRKMMNVFVEPDNRDQPSQIQEYVDAYYGSGVQHMAFYSNDLLGNVARMRTTGVDFVNFPDGYYDALRKEKKLPESFIDKIQECRVLCDVQGDAMLMQTFTKPFGDRPTFFYEIIQRTEGYEGFAPNNLTQLFKAVEEEQERRQNRAAGEADPKP